MESTPPLNSNESDSIQISESNLPYYGLLVYTVLFYSQIAGRFPVLEPLRIELVVGTIVLICALIRLITGKVRFNENKLNFVALLFLITAFITIPFALVKMRALDTFIRLFKFCAIYLMIIATIDSEKKLRVFIYVYLSMITLIFMEPFILSLQGKGFVWNNHMWRLAGITNYFWHPNQLGGITAANLPFFFYLIKYQKSKLGKIIYLLLLLISLRVIMLTQSRTAFVGVLIFGLFILILSNKKIIFLTILLLCMVVLWQVSPQETKDRFISLGDVNEVISGEYGHEEAGSMYSRWVLIQRGLIAFKENPILGLGLNCYISFNGQRYGYWFPPHNTYIQALSEMGIIGFAIFMALLIIIIKNANYARRILIDIDKKDSIIYYLALSLLVYIFVRIMVSMFGQDLYANYWWVSGGLSVVVMRLAQNEYQMQLESGEEIDSLNITNS